MALARTWRRLSRNGAALGSFLGMFDARDLSGEQTCRLRHRSSPHGDSIVRQAPVGCAVARIHPPARSANELMITQFPRTVPDHPGRQISPGAAGLAPGLCSQSPPPSIAPALREPCASPTGDLFEKTACTPPGLGVVLSPACRTTCAVSTSPVRRWHFCHRTSSCKAISISHCLPVARAALIGVPITRARTQQTVPVPVWGSAKLSCASCRRGFQILHYFRGVDSLSALAFERFAGAASARHLDPKRQALER